MTACKNKECVEDPPWTDCDTGSSGDGGSSDGGSGDGGSGDGGDDIGTRSALGIPHSCAPVDSIGNASHFAAAEYFSDSAPDEEFACSFTLEDYWIEKVYKTEVRGTPSDYGSYVVLPAAVGVEVPWQEAQLYVDSDTRVSADGPWTTFSATDEAQWDPSGEEGLSVPPDESIQTNPNGEYIVRFPNRGIKLGVEPGPSRRVRPTSPRWS